MPARDLDEPEIPADRTASPDDKSSVPASRPRRSGDGPYRDAREVLLAKRRRTRRRLEEAERAARRADELRKELDYVDASLRSTSSALVARVRATTPCRERWDEMVGDDVVRHCARCRKDVFDLATMRTHEAEALLERERMGPAPLRRRRDGRVVAGTCPASHGGVKIAGALTFAAACAALVAHVDTVRPANETSTAGTAQASRASTRPTPRMADHHRVLESNLFRDLEDEDREDAPQPLTLRPFVLDERALMEAWPSDTRLLPITLGHDTTRVVVYGVREGSALASMGLRDGDVLLAIAGQPLHDLDDVLAALAVLEKHGGAVVELERDGVFGVHGVVLRRS